MHCNASGDPVPSFAWFKDGIAMVEAAGIKPFHPVLVLEDAIKEDEARYYCVASNIAGKTQSNSANLKVFGEYIFAIETETLSCSKQGPYLENEKFDVTTETTPLTLTLLHVGCLLCCETTTLLFRFVTKRLFW